MASSMDYCLDQMVNLILCLRSEHLTILAKGGDQ